MAMVPARPTLTRCREVRAARHRLDFELDCVTREEVKSRGTGRYEVLTTDGVPVRLRDMSFMGLTYEPTSKPALELRFGYDDRTCTPQSAAATPTAVFTFRNAVVLQHEDAPVEPDTPAGALRQVGGSTATTRPPRSPCPPSRPTSSSRLRA